MRMSGKFNDELYSSSSQQLLNTIKVPLNLHYLTDKLPSPNYDPLDNRISINTDYQGMASISKKDDKENKTKKIRKKSVKRRDSSLEPRIHILILIFLIQFREGRERKKNIQEVQVTNMELLSRT